MEADEVTVVVHGARGLQGRKPGRHKYSVIFGIGNKKYRTSVVKDPSGNPDWNEESVVHVSNVSDDIFFTVTEKDDVLGNITIPVASLLTVKGVVKKGPLKNHKKCQNPQGELIFQCYVSKQRPIMVAPQIRSNTMNNSGPQLTGFQRLRHNFTQSPTAQKQKKEEKEDKKKSSSLANFNKKLSKSIHDIFHLGRLENRNDFQDEDQSGEGKNKRFSLRFPSVGSGLDDTGREIPIVTHIVPNMANINGGTRLSIEGRNLGIGKSDILELILCGSDLLDTVEFESDNRIYVTTKPTSAGKGDLWIETAKGGQNVLKNIFTFVDRSSTNTPLPDKKMYDNNCCYLIISIQSLGTSEDFSIEALSETDVFSETAVFSAKLSARAECLPRLEIEDRQRIFLSGSATLPRIQVSSEDNVTPSHGSPSGMYKKNFQKHNRTASESVVDTTKDSESKRIAEKSELQAEILRLHKENQALKQENADMKMYIDGLVARVIVRCPEALAAGDDLKPLPPRT
uniref:C2 domain-containing protein n=1 Tax=Biomphalaria glabrata TaxID=6526 RepID=A0A2C9KWF7_BIOGL